MKRRKSIVAARRLAFAAALGVWSGGVGCESAGGGSNVGSHVRHAVNFSGVPPQSEPKVQEDAPKRSK